VPVSGKRPIDVDVFLEDDRSQAVEIIECKEHESWIPPSSIKEFLRRVQILRAGHTVSPQTRFRFVTNARFLRAPRRGWSYDLKNSKERELAFRAMNLATGVSADPFDEMIIWDFDAGDKDTLTAHCLFHISQANSREHTRIYLRFYAQLAAQMSSRLGLDESQRKELLRDPLLYICKTVESEKEYAEVLPSDHIDVPAFGRLLSVHETTLTARHQIIGKQIRSLAERQLFPDTPVKIKEVYVTQNATFLNSAPPKRERCPSSGAAEEIFLNWLAERRSDQSPRLPLLVLGDFGHGKSIFLAKMTECLWYQDPTILPIFVQLRDLVAAEGHPGSLRDALFEHVRNQWDVDLDEPSRKATIRYCLLCDGFDELNLRFYGMNVDEWVREAFAALRALAERRDVCVVISSRRILLMDVQREDSLGRECPALQLLPFNDLLIEEWCSNYRAAAGMSVRLGIDFLRKRSLLEVARTPIILYMITRIMETSPKLLTSSRAYSKAEVYQCFIDWTCQGGYAADTKKHRLPRNYRQILQEIAWVLFQHQGLAKEEVVLNHLKQHKGLVSSEDFPVARNLLVAHMLQPAAMAKGDRPDNVIEFTHQSFREYLVTERIWDTLKLAREGNEVMPETWRQLMGAPFTPNKVSFLSEMIESLPTREAVCLYKALETAQNPCAYWARWLSPLLGDLMNVSDAKAREVIRVKQIGNWGLYSCGLATLATLIRIKCFARVRQANPAMLRRLSNKSTAECLSRLLHFLLVFGESAGLAYESRQLLLSNLDGLVLNRGDSLTHHKLDGLNLRNGVLRGVNLFGSIWSQADLTGTDFTGASFTHAFLSLRCINRARFASANFLNSVISQEENQELVGANFSEACFEGAQFKNLAMIDCKFKGNNWDRATVVFQPSGEHRGPYLARCKLDKAAADFFAQAGISLDNCKTIV